MTIFNAIKFNPATKKLSINGENNTCLYSYDLSTTAVKLEVKRVDGHLKVAIETGTVGSFGTNRMEQRLKFSGTSHYTSILFDAPAGNIDVQMDNDTAEICKGGDFYALLVGSDDIRNNRTATNMVLLEGEIVSFEIDTAADMVIVRYHNLINPTV
ncbi:MAG: hypothetical protein ACRBFS_01715 [Aureispira sp.]